jgi:Tfp pilus assembly protein PilN
MIRIDLLPQEYRKAERTPAGILFATMGLAALISTTLAAGAYAWFGVVGKARADVQVAQETFDSKKALTVYADKLEAEKQEYTARLDHIKKFGDSRIVWTKKLDQLASLVDSPAEENRHTVWLEKLEMRMNGGRNQGVKMKGHSATAEVKKLSNFHRDLASGAFFTDFIGISNPAGKVLSEEEYSPAESWEFEFALALEGAEEEKNAPPAKAEAPASKTEN